LGANAILGVSLAAAHAGAALRRLPLYRHFHACQQAVADGAGAIPPPQLPLPMTNMISGGLHAGHNLDFQDVLVIPVAAPDLRTGLEWIVRVYNRLGALLGGLRGSPGG
jgi:enolase